MLQMTRSRLTNDTVQKAFVKLALDLRNGLAPTLSTEEPRPNLVVGDEAAFLVLNIKDHWTMYFARQGPVASADLIGVRSGDASAA